LNLSTSNISISNVSSISIGVNTRIGMDYLLNDALGFWGPRQNGTLNPTITLVDNQDLTSSRGSRILFAGSLYTSNTNVNDCGFFQYDGILGSLLPGNFLMGGCTDGKGVYIYNGAAYGPVYASNFNDMVPDEIEYELLRFNKSILSYVLTLDKDDNKLNYTNFPKSIIYKVNNTVCKNKNFSDCHLKEGDNLNIGEGVIFNSLEIAELFKELCKYQNKTFMDGTKIKFIFC